MQITDIPKDDGRPPTKSLLERWLEVDGSEVVDLEAMRNFKGARMPIERRIIDYDPLADARTDEERRRDFLAKCDKIIEQKKK